MEKHRTKEKKINSEWDPIKPANGFKIQHNVFKTTQSYIINFIQYFYIASSIEYNGLLFYR